MPRTCVVCGAALGPRGRLYCGPAHKMRAARRRAVGLPEDDFPDGFRAGRRSLRDEAERRRRDREFFDAVLATIRH